MEDVLFGLAGLILGGILGWLCPRQVKSTTVERRDPASLRTIVLGPMREAPAPAPLERKPVLSPSPGRSVVEFHFANKAIERKTLFNHSLDQSILWRNKLFTEAPNSPAQYKIYHEVI